MKNEEEKKSGKREPLEQKFVSCQFLNNKPKIPLIAVVLKSILEGMKVQYIFFIFNLFWIWAKAVSKIIYLVEFF